MLISYNESLAPTSRRLVRGTITVYMPATIRFMETFLGNVRIFFLLARQKKQVTYDIAGPWW